MRGINSVVISAVRTWRVRTKCKWLTSYPLVSVSPCAMILPVQYARHCYLFAEWLQHRRSGVWTNNYDSGSAPIRTTPRSDFRWLISQPSTQWRNACGPCTNLVWGLSPFISPFVFPHLNSHSEKDARLSYTSFRAGIYQKLEIYHFFAFFLKLCMTNAACCRCCPDDKSTSRFFRCKAWGSTSLYGNSNASSEAYS